jgi:hypothetical protein
LAATLDSVTGRTSRFVCIDSALAMADFLGELAPVHKLGTLMDEAEHDVLAFMTFPRAR